MKRGILLALLLLSSLFLVATVNAAGCNLDISLINQNPYPAIPGDYIKIVFQIDGVGNPECGNVEFELLEQYPLIFDPNENPIVKITAGTYHKDFNSFLIAPYKVRIDKDALNGETPIEVRYKYKSQTIYLQEEFNINIEDSRADFEVYVKNYNPLTKELILEILNTAKSDVEALTIEIPQQENIEIKGAKTNIVGDLDSNDYTTASFEAIPKKGEIQVKISYTDTINTRRVLEKTVLFEPEYFQDRNGETKKVSIWLYLFLILSIVNIVRYYLRRRKKKRKLREKRAKH